MLLFGFGELIGPMDHRPRISLNAAALIVRQLMRGRAAITFLHSLQESGLKGEVVSELQHKTDYKRKLILLV